MSGSSEHISHEELSYVDGVPTYSIVIKDLMTKMRKWNYNQRISTKPLTVNGVTMIIRILPTSYTDGYMSVWIHQICDSFNFYEVEFKVQEVTKSFKSYFLGRQQVGIDEFYSHPVSNEKLR